MGSPNIIPAQYDPRSPSYTLLYTTTKLITLYHDQTKFFTSSKMMLGYPSYSAERRQRCTTTTIRSRRAHSRRVLDTAALNAYVPNDVGSKSHSELTWNVVAGFTFFGLLMTALVSLCCWSHVESRRPATDFDLHGFSAFQDHLVFDEEMRCCRVRRRLPIIGRKPGKTKRTVEELESLILKAEEEVAMWRELELYYSRVGRESDLPLMKQNTSDTRLCILKMNKLKDELKAEKASWMAAAKAQNEEKQRQATIKAKEEKWRQATIKAKEEKWRQAIIKAKEEKWRQAIIKAKSQGVEPFKSGERVEIVHTAKFVRESHKQGCYTVTYDDEPNQLRRIKKENVRRPVEDRVRRRLPTVEELNCSIKKLQNERAAQPTMSDFQWHEYAENINKLKQERDALLS